MPLTYTPGTTRIDLVVNKGEGPYDLVLPVLDDEDRPVEVTGWTGRAQVRHSSIDTLLHEWTTADATMTCAGTTAVLHITATAWPWSDARYDVEIVEPGGRVHRIAEGAVRALDEITH